MFKLGSRVWNVPCGTPHKIPCNDNEPFQFLFPIPSSCKLVSFISYQHWIKDLLRGDQQYRRMIWIERTHGPEGNFLRLQFPLHNPYTQLVAGKRAPLIQHDISQSLETDPRNRITKCLGCLNTLYKKHKPHLNEAGNIQSHQFGHIQVERPWCAHTRLEHRFQDVAVTDKRNKNFLSTKPKIVTRSSILHCKRDISSSSTGAWCLLCLQFTFYLFADVLSSS